MAQATAKKYEPPLGSLPVLAYCAPEQLLIDDSYQRSIETADSQRLIARIAARWDWAKCGVLNVAKRPDGGLYVVDGQHRLNGARLRGDIHQLPCLVKEFESAEQEAAMFVALNQHRRPLSPLELFKAAVASKDFEACQVVQCVEAAGLRIATSSNLFTLKPGSISNVGGLLKAYRAYGIPVLETALKILAAAYPNQVLRYGGSIFPGIVVVAAGEIANRADLVELVPAVAKFVGARQQHEWTRASALAQADDPNLSRSKAMQKVMRRDWSGYNHRQAMDATVLPVSAQPIIYERGYGPGDGDSRVIEPTKEPEVQSAKLPRPTFLRPAERAWCDQCEALISGKAAAGCRSRYCKLKAPEAAE